MSWVDVLKVAGSVVAILTAVVVPVLWAALQRWGSEVWAPLEIEEEMATQEDLDGLGTRVERLQEEQAETRRLAMTNEDRLDLLEQEQRHQSERIMDQVIGPLEKIADRLERIDDSQSAQGVAVGRLEESVKGLGRSVDDLRARIERQEEAS